MSNRERIGATAFRQLALFVGVSICLLVIVTVIAMFSLDGLSQSSELRSAVVQLNELSQESSVSSEDAIAVAQDALRDAAASRDATALIAVLVVAVVAAICLIVAASYFYFSIVRPFSKLQDFADSVASGNLDLPLEYERSNPFGRFAWAFDHMRSELKRARANELAAIEDNKSAIASLAHDLRTPIASIGTYSEALEMDLFQSDAERRECAEVIQRKCSDISRLVNDVLTHALANLDRITVECAIVPASPLLRQAVEEFGVTETRVIRADDATIDVDELRLRQAIENVLVNASKYAPGSVVEAIGEVSDDGFYRIRIRDYGPGMSPEDIPFAFDRFYRGSNAKEIDGSGIGLFLVQHLVERMGGSVFLNNAHPGLEVVMAMRLEDSARS